MSALSDIREALVADLSEVLPAFQQVPRRFEAPGILVVPTRNGSYVTGGDAFRSLVVNVELWICIRPNNDEKLDLDQLDDYLLQVLEVTADWGLDGVDPVTLANFDGAEYPVTVVRISKPFTTL